MKGRRSLEACLYVHPSAHSQIHVYTVIEVVSRNSLMDGNLLFSFKFSFDCRLLLILSLFFSDIRTYIRFSSIKNFF